MAAIFFCHIMIPYLVSRFDKSTLSNLVKESFGSNFPDIFQKKQIDYIYRYLKDLGAKSILLEFEYIDKDFLEDYSRYYVKRFSSNGNKCARLHFFTSEIQHTSINDALTNASASTAIAELQENYLGFVVVKPLPKTFIGKTCLKRYPLLIEDNARNCIYRIYNVDLFGIKLTVDSVAFQEQDKVVSACATTAIWSSLHAAQSDGTRGIPACSEITINAINHIDGSSNTFPSKELSNKQIMRSLDFQKLRNHHLELDVLEKEEFFNIVKYYIDSKLPLILGVNVYAIKNDILQPLAGHAVTILGYKESSSSAIYIHDDRLGPFARAAFMNLDEYPQAKSAGISQKWALVLQEKDDNGKWRVPHELFVPSSLIIPTDKKVRLPHTFAESTCEFIKSEYNLVIDALKKSVEEETPGIAFELKLAEISEIRQELIKCKFDDASNPLDVDELNREKIAFLTKSYARFHWVADFFIEGKLAFRILFDATDIPQGKGIAGIFRYHKERSEAVFSVLQPLSSAERLLEQSLSGNFSVAFLRHLKLPALDYSRHLDVTYGELRAPLYLKSAETKNGDVADNLDRLQYFESTPKSLEDIFGELIVADNSQSFFIWTVSHDGSLLIGPEKNEIGHPGLTQFKPSRIAGELSRKSDGWYLNAKSGRYSGDYVQQEAFLDNAVEKFRSIFYKSRDHIFAAPKA